MSDVEAALAATGRTGATIVAESELGALVEADGETLLVSPPYDPEGSGVLTLRSVGPPPPALPRRPAALVAALPDAGTVSLQTPEGMRALARELGGRLAPLTLIRLLVSQATAAGLPALVEDDRLAALLAPGAALPEPPAIAPRADGGWRARFASVTQLAAPGEPLRTVVQEWRAELSPERGLVWWTAEHSR